MTDYKEYYGASGELPVFIAADAVTKHTETYEKRERILSFLCMAVGFLFVRLCCYHVTGLLTTLLFCLITTMCILYLRSSGKTFGKSQKALVSAMAYKDVLDTSCIESVLKDFESECSEDFYQSLNLSAWQILANGGASE